MAAPNLASPANIDGKTAVLAVPITATTVVSAATNTTVRIASLAVANLDTVTGYWITLDLYRSSTAYRFAYQINVAPKSSVVLIGRDGPIYLEAGDTLRATAQTVSKLEIVCSYEVVS